jgi:hypothetical protein
MDILRVIVPPEPLASLPCIEWTHILKRIHLA